MRAAEGLVRVVVHHVRAKIARPRDPQDGVHVRAVQIDQPASLMHQFGNLRNLLVKDSQRAGIGDHEHGNLVIQLRLQILHVHKSRGIAADGDKLEPRHPRAGGIGAVGAIGRENLGADEFPVAEIRRGDHERGQFSMSPRGRLQRDGGQAGDFRQHLLHLVEQLQHALDGVIRLMRMQVGNAGKRGHPLVPLAVVLHRAGAERIEVRIDRHVEGREVGEVPHHFRLRNLRQRQKPFRQCLLRQQLFDCLHWDVARRQRGSAAAGFGEFEEEGRGLEVAHRQ